MYDLFPAVLRVNEVKIIIRYYNMAIQSHYKYKGTIKLQAEIQTRVQRNTRDWSCYIKYIMVRWHRSS